ncbi:MAG: cytochrome oxidase assembly protein [Planctomycetaceae bacterium]|nr:cytochrome oxidase assembly protein [Planctomycetaceae bacterium]
MSSFESYNSNGEHRRWPHRLAVALTCATFPLIWVGGLVTTSDAGMAVPDWPTTYGYNLILYPWQTWIAGPWDVFIEHGHRLLGVLVGCLTIALWLAILRGGSPRWLRGCATLALVGVVAQGVLGGMRVLLDQRTLAFLHGCVGPAFFAYCAALCVFTSPRWRATSPVAAAIDLKKLHRLAVLTTGIAYLQLVIGGQLRHVHFGTSPRVFQIAVLFHLIGAAVLFGYCLWLSRVAWRLQPVRRPAIALSLLVVLQIALGSGTWFLKYALPTLSDNWALTAAHTLQSGSLSQAVTVTSHVATGSLILATAVLVMVRVWRLSRQRGAVTPSSTSFVEALV